MKELYFIAFGTIFGMFIMLAFLVTYWKYDARKRLKAYDDSDAKIRKAQETKELDDEWIEFLKNKSSALENKSSEWKNNL